LKTTGNVTGFVDQEFSKRGNKMRKRIKPPTTSSFTYNSRIRGESNIHAKKETQFTTTDREVGEI
jgi:hypothetical protein